MPNSVVERFTAQRHENTGFRKIHSIMPDIRGGWLIIFSQMRVSHLSRKQTISVDQIFRGSNANEEICFVSI